MKADLGLGWDSLGQAIEFTRVLPVLVIQNVLKNVREVLGLW